MPETAEAPQRAAYWPVPPEWPLYVTIERAAEIAGVSYQTMSAWANARTDPIPHIAVGRAKKLIRTAAIPEYAMTKEMR